MEIDTASHLFSPRYNNLKKLLESFPKRRFVLVGDTATGSVLSAYGALVKEFPKQVHCILLRDVSATEPANWIEPNLKAIPKDKHRLFAKPDELLPGSVTLTQRLADGRGQGCGDLTFASTATRHRGNLVSWIITIWRGVSSYVFCLVQFDMREDSLCRFDKMKSDL